jgi:hypothetical protein
MPEVYKEELSTRGDLLISFYDPGNGHVRIAAYPWRE